MLFFFTKQIIWVCLGSLAMIFFMHFDYLNLAKYSRAFLLFIVILLLLVLASPFGKEVNGAKRWLALGSIRIQPAEFAKLALMIYLADAFTRKQDRLKYFWKGVFPQFMVMMCVLALIIAQPDKSMTIFIGICGIILWFVAGAKLKHIIIPVILISLMVGFVIMNSENAMGRINSFLHPESNPTGNYQVQQSRIAIMLGGMWGVGLGESRQKLQFLPFPHTDFIFAILAEESGFVGAALVIITFIIIIIAGMATAMKSEDLFGSLLAVGMTLIIGLQATINICVVTGLCPATGIALPFLSYGGSSLISLMSASGILINVARSIDK